MDLDALILGLLLVVSGAALCWAAWLGSQRRLPRNLLVGIRVPGTLAGDEAWAVAHQAAAGPLGLGGAILAGGGVALLAAGTFDVIGTTVVTVAVLAMLLAVLVAGRVGLKAAREAIEPDEGRGPAPI